MLVAESRRVALEKQRADKTLGAQRRRRGHPLYLAIHDSGASDRLHAQARLHE